MKVILFEDVKNVGKKDDVVELKDGYARNVIIKKGLGVEATPKAMNDLRVKKKKEEKLAAEKLADAQALKAEVETKELVIAMKLGNNGKTFGSVSTKEVAAEAKKQLGFDLDKKKMVVEPIKTLGVHNVTLKLHPQVTANLKVKVVEK
ncbi:MAG: 50S ribosomal protein L9 [Lachnospiraceae bacterium]|nr:50S ribosomal protein L9 [Lachnospiraceae bacterium]